MRITPNVHPVPGRLRCKPAAKLLLTLAFCLAILIWTGAAQAGSSWPHIAASKDGTPISYEVFGKGEPALVFIHGWNCDSRYWRAQVPLFARNHRVITLDLAGHGHSGSGRTRYTMASFGEDVKAVVEAVGSRRVILVGHSLGASVIAEAAVLMPERVVGLIGVDTLENVEFPLTQEGFEKMRAPFERDFPAACRKFVEQMLYPGTDPKLREWILADMSAAPPAVAMSAFDEMLSQYVTGEAARIFEKIPAPVVAINGDLSPVNYEANRRHMASFDAIVIKKADHFLMMDRPAEFNAALKKAIRMVSAKKGK